MELISLLEIDTTKINRSEERKLEKYLQVIVDEELTDKQKVVLCGKLKGETITKIADKINIGKSTTCRHMSKVIRKLNKHLKYAKVFLEYENY